MKCCKCEAEGKSVPSATVKALLKKSNKISDYEYYACMDAQCDVIYYTNKEVFTFNQVTITPWYKDYVEHKVLCYCDNISQDDLDRLMIEHPEEGYEALMQRINRRNERDCLHNNPLGKCCHGTIKSYIDTARSKDF